MRRAAVLLLLVAACSPDDTPAGPYAARVGDAVLTDDALQSELPPGYDPASDDGALRQAVLDGWIDRQLLLQEARRAGIYERADVQRQIAENTEALVIGSLVEVSSASAPARVDDEAIERYYAQNPEDLALREPHVRLSVFAGRTRQAAEQARAAARRAPAQAPDWSGIDEAARVTADTVAAERALPVDDAAVAEAARALAAGSVSRVLEADGRFVVVALHERVGEGEVPPARWVRSVIEERLRVSGRRTALRRLVSSLRDQARARGTLEVLDARAPASEPAISADTLR